MPKLIVTNREQGVRVYDVKDGDKLNIGRESDNEIILIDSRVSRSHACIYCRASKLYVADLSSRNGTILNGELILKDQQIFDKDIINVGNTAIEVKSDPDKPALIEAIDPTSTSGFSYEKITAAQFRVKQSLSETQLEVFKIAIKSTAGQIIHNDPKWSLVWWKSDSYHSKADHAITSALNIIERTKTEILGLNVFIFNISAVLEDQDPSWNINFLGDPIKICEEFDGILESFNYSLIVEGSIVQKLSDPTKFKSIANINFKSNLPPCKLYGFQE